MKRLLPVMLVIMAVAVLGLAVGIKKARESRQAIPVPVALSPNYECGVPVPTDANLPANTYRNHNGRFSRGLGARSGGMQLAAEVACYGTIIDPNVVTEYDVTWQGVTP